MERLHATSDSEALSGSSSNGASRRPPRASRTGSRARGGRGRRRGPRRSRSPMPGEDRSQALLGLQRPLEVALADHAVAHEHVSEVLPVGVADCVRDLSLQDAEAAAASDRTGSGAGRTSPRRRRPAGSGRARSGRAGARRRARRRVGRVAGSAGASGLVVDIAGVGAPEPSPRLRTAVSPRRGQGGVVEAPRERIGELGARGVAVVRVLGQRPLQDRDEAFVLRSRPAAGGPAPCGRSGTGWRPGSRPRTVAGR